MGPYFWELSLGLQKHDLFGGGRFIAREPRNPQNGLGFRVSQAAFNWRYMKVTWHLEVAGSGGLAGLRFRA